MATIIHQRPRGHRELSENEKRHWLIGMGDCHGTVWLLQGSLNSIFHQLSIIWATQTIFFTSLNCLFSLLPHRSIFFLNGQKYLWHQTLGFISCGRKVFLTFDAYNKKSWKFLLPPSLERSQREIRLAKKWSSFQWKLSIGLSFKYWWPGVWQPKAS